MGDLFHRAGEPDKHLDEVQADQLDRGADDHAGEALHVGVLDAYREESDLLFGFLLLQALGGKLHHVLGFALRFAIGDHKDPGAIIGDAVGPVLIFAVLDHVERPGDRATHEGLPLRRENGWLEAIHGDEILGGLDLVIESDDRHLHAPGGERILEQILLERLQAFVERLDGRALHGAGGIQQQDAWAAWFGIFRELDCLLEI